MPLGYEYKRYFIILQEEEKGYEIAGGKIPTGYVKIEIKKDKVKVTGFIQNIIWDEKSEYKMILLAPKAKIALDLGRFRMDNSGRGEFYCELDSDNVLGRGLDITEFTAALVASGARVPLFGYVGRERVSWKEWYNKKEETPKREIIEEVREEVQEETEIIEEVREEAQEETEIIEEVREKVQEEAEIIEEVREKVQEEAEIIEEVREEVQKEAEIIEEVREEVQEEAKIIEEAREEAQEDEEPIYRQMPHQHYFHNVDMGGVFEYKDSMHKRLVKALRNLDEFRGFEKIGNQRWFVLGNNIYILNSVIINLNGVKMPLSYPYIAESCSFLMSRCILGVEYDDGEIMKILIGIPGVYKRECKPCYRHKGFTGYKRTKNGKIGYWIMCIDIKKGKICNM